MKKIIFLFITLSFGLMYSQKSKSKNPIEKQKDTTLNKHYRKIDSTNLIEKNKKNSGIAFYKNIDSTKASKYKMLNKKPSEQYSQLQQHTAPLTIEKKNDTTIVKKNK